MIRSPVARRGSFLVEKTLMIRCIPFALGVLLLLTPANAQPRHHDLSPMRIVIETIDHSKQRYPTFGDWRVKHRLEDERPSL